MKTLPFSVIVIFVFISNYSIGQGWDATFPSDSLFGSTGFSIGFDVAPTQDGGYLLGGEVDYPTGAIRHFIRLVKTDAQGNKEWSHVYKAMEIANEQLVFVEELTNGEIMIGGSQNGDPYLMKTNSMGVPIWETSFQYDTAHRVKDGLITADENIVLAGHVSSISNVFYPFIIKTNIDGDLIWEKNLLSPTPFYLSSISATSDGGFIVTGSTEFYFDIVLAKLDSMGEIEWQETYDFSTSDEAYSVVETLDKGFVLGGSIQGINEEVPLIFKTDSVGNGEWLTLLTDGVFGWVMDIAIQSDSSYLVTGDVLNFFGFDNHGFVTQIDKQGEVLWQENFTPIGQFFSKIKLTLDNGIILSGVEDGNMLLKKMGGTTSQKNIFSKSELNIFPNPFQNQTTFQFKNLEFKTIHLQVYDSIGKLVREETHSSSEFIFQSDDLRSGLYFYKITNKKLLITQGKLLIQN